MANILDKRAVETIYSVFQEILFLFFEKFLVPPKNFGIVFQ